MHTGSIPTRRYVFGLAAAACTAMLAAGSVSTATRADQSGVDLVLVLAVDVSGSVNQRRYELQRDGYASAFRDPRVLKAIRGGGLRGAIAVTLVQWTGPTMQVHAVPWSVVSDEGSAENLAADIAAMPRQLFAGGTSISGAIDYGADLLRRAPFTGGRRVIDVSGDGANNRGIPAAQARDAAIARGITINGLPILELERDLDEHYKNNVIGGENAFMVVARTFDEFADAVLKKLVIEISGIAGPQRHAALD
jgi:Protein of unknown function (DUF1194)